MALSSPAALPGFQGRSDAVSGQALELRAQTPDPLPREGEGRGEERLGTGFPFFFGRPPIFLPTCLGHPTALGDRLTGFCRKNLKIAVVAPFWQGWNSFLTPGFRRAPPPPMQDDRKSTFSGNLSRTQLEPQPQVAAPLGVGQPHPAVPVAAHLCGGSFALEVRGRIGEKRNPSPTSCAGWGEWRGCTSAWVARESGCLLGQPPLCGGAQEANSAQRPGVPAADLAMYGTCGELVPEVEPPHCTLAVVVHAVSDIPATAGPLAVRLSVCVRWAGRRGRPRPQLCKKK